MSGLRHVSAPTRGAESESRTVGSFADVAEVRFHPTRTSDPDTERAAAEACARDLAKNF